MARLERLEQAVAAGATTGAPAKAVPTDPGTGRATIGGRARRPAEVAATPSAPSSTPSTAHPSQPTAEPPTTSVAATSQASIDDSDIPALFEKTVRPALRGMTKAIFMGAHIGTMVDGALQIGFAGEPHRVRAEEYRREVERALAAATGRPVPITLVVDHTAHDDNVVQLKRAEVVAADEDIDTGDLVDAPPGAIVSPIDRLTQAFPGSEIIDERS
jgi:DNA polymerase-3 subunit gamma/tau